MPKNVELRVPTKGLLTTAVLNKLEKGTAAAAKGEHNAVAFYWWQRFSRCKNDDERSAVAFEMASTVQGLRDQLAGLQRALREAGL